MNEEQHQAAGGRISQPGNGPSEAPQKKGPPQRRNSKTTTSSQVGKFYFGVPADGATSMCAGAFDTTSMASPSTWVPSEGCSPPDMPFSPEDEWNENATSSSSSSSSSCSSFSSSSSPTSEDLHQRTTVLEATQSFVLAEPVPSSSSTSDEEFELFKAEDHVFAFGAEQLEPAPAAMGSRSCSQTVSSVLATITEERRESDENVSFPDGLDRLPVARRSNRSCSNEFFDDILLDDLPEDGSLDARTSFSCRTNNNDLLVLPMPSGEEYLRREQQSLFHSPLNCGLLEDDEVHVKHFADMFSEERRSNFMSACARGQEERGAGGGRGGAGVGAAHHENENEMDDAFSNFSSLGVVSSGEPTLSEAEELRENKQKKRMEDVKTDSLLKMAKALYEQEEQHQAATAHHVLAEPGRAVSGRNCDLRSPASADRAAGPCLQYRRLKSLLQAAQSEPRRPVAGLLSHTSSARKNRPPALRFVPSQQELEEEEDAPLSAVTATSGVAPDLPPVLQPGDLLAARPPRTNNQEVEFDKEEKQNPVCRSAVPTRTQEQIGQRAASWGSDLQPTKLTYASPAWGSDLQPSKLRYAPTPEEDARAMQARAHAFTENICGALRQRQRGRGEELSAADGATNHFPAATLFGGGAGRSSSAEAETAPHGGASKVEESTSDERGMLIPMESVAGRTSASSVGTGVTTLPPASRPSVEYTASELHSSASGCPSDADQQEGNFGSGSSLHDVTIHHLAGSCAGAPSSGYPLSYSYEGALSHLSGPGLPVELSGQPPSIYDYNVAGSGVEYNTYGAEMLEDYYSAYNGGAASAYSETPEQLYHNSAPAAVYIIPDHADYAAGGPAASVGCNSSVVGVERHHFYHDTPGGSSSMAASVHSQRQEHLDHPQEHHEQSCVGSSAAALFAAGGDVGTHDGSHRMSYHHPNPARAQAYRPNQSPLQLDHVVHRSHHHHQHHSNKYSSHSGTKHKQPNFAKGLQRYQQILNPGPGSFSQLHPVIQEQVGLYQKRHRLGNHKLDTNGILHVTSYLINRYFHKLNPDISPTECWQMVWSVVDYMERHSIPSNSRVWCMMCSAFEKYRPENGKTLYYPVLLRQFYTFTSPQTGYYNAHADAALVRLMCFCGYVDDAWELVNNRRCAYKVGSQNFQFRFLLFQALLDFVNVHYKAFCGSPVVSSSSGAACSSTSSPTPRSELDNVLRKDTDPPTMLMSCLRAAPLPHGGGTNVGSSSTWLANSYANCTTTTSAAGAGGSLSLAEKCRRIECDVRRWIDEDGIDSVDDIAIGKPVERDPAKQIHFLGVRAENATHSRQRSSWQDRGLLSKDEQ